MARYYQLNPAAFDEDLLRDKLNEEAENLTEQDKERILDQADLFKNSNLLKSYELLIQKYESEFEVKNAQLRDFDRQLQQIQVENTNLANQVFQFKT